MNFIIFLMMLLMVSTVNAEEITYSMDGYAQAAYGYGQENHAGFGKGGTDVTLNYESEETVYSLHADFMFGVDKELKDYNQGNWGEEIYGVVDAKYGQLMVGQVYNVASLFHNGAPMIGVLSSNSDVVNFLHNPNWHRFKKETKFATLTSTDINTDGAALKINYITPEFYGTAMGITWVPDSYNRRGLINKHAGYAHKDGIIAAIYSDHHFGSINTKTSIGYGQYHGNDKEFSLSQSVNRGNWTIGGGFRKTYVDGDNKTLPNRILPNDFDGYREGYGWNFGVEYTIGPFNSALSYFESKQKEKNNVNNAFVWSNAYQFNKYVDIYVATAALSYKCESQKDSGWAGIVGLGVNF